MEGGEGWRRDGAAFLGSPGSEDSCLVSMTARILSPHYKVSNSPGVELSRRAQAPHHTALPEAWGGPSAHTVSRPEVPKCVTDVTVGAKR